MCAPYFDVTLWNHFVLESDQSGGTMKLVVLITSVFALVGSNFSRCQEVVGVPDSALKLYCDDSTTSTRYFVATAPAGWSPPLWLRKTTSPDFQLAGFQFPNHPVMLMSFENASDNTGFYIFKNGAFMKHVGPQAFPLGRCAVVPENRFKLSQLPIQRGFLEINPYVLQQEARYGELSDRRSEHVPMRVDEAQAVSCASKNVGDEPDFLSCLVQHMGSPATRKVYSCVENTITDRTEAACIAEKLSPTAREIGKRVKACTNDGKVDAVCVATGFESGFARNTFRCISEMKAQSSWSSNAYTRGICLADADPALGKVVNAVSRCAKSVQSLDPATDEPISIDPTCLESIGLAPRTIKLYTCAVGSTHTAAQRKQCLEEIGVDPALAAAAAAYQSCSDESSDAEQFAVCAVAQAGDERLARAAQCFEDNARKGDTTVLSTALCYGAGELPVNAETKIAIECAGEANGDPWAYAGCVGGRLTVREMARCVTNGVGGSGCFGPNNEIVLRLRQLGFDINKPLDPDSGVGRAWNDIQHDLLYGPGNNNEFARLVPVALPLMSLPPAPAEVQAALNNAVSDVRHGPGPNNDLVRAANNIANGVNEFLSNATVDINVHF
jgi:hypothetical protein